MSTAKRACATAVAALGIAAAPIVLSGSAFAAPYVQAAVCTTAVGNPAVGDHLKLACARFLAHEKVKIELHSKIVTLATVTADADGAVDVSVKLPNDVKGDHFVTATGLTSGKVARVDIFIGAGDNGDDDSDGDNSGSGGGSALPRTGAAIGGLGLLGAALVGGGVVLRRRARQ